MRPSRETIRSNEFAYFVSTQTIGRKPFFRHDRWARLMVDVLKHYDGNGYALHAFIVMPDHLHLLLTPVESVEKSVQLIKGGFSFRAKRELEWTGEIWQTGFTDHRVRDEVDWDRHLGYIRQNPVDGKLVSDSVLYEFMRTPNIAFPRGLKPGKVGDSNVRAEARTLHSNAAVEAEVSTLQSETPLISGGAAKAVPFQNDFKTTEIHGFSEAVPFQSQGLERLKPTRVAAEDVRAEARTLHPESKQIR